MSELFTAIFEGWLRIILLGCIILASLVLCTVAYDALGPYLGFIVILAGIIATILSIMDIYYN